jgi:hypothetical protein
MDFCSAGQYEKYQENIKRTQALYHSNINCTVCRQMHSLFDQIVTGNERNEDRAC